MSNPIIARILSFNSRSIGCAMLGFFFAGTSGAGAATIWTGPVINFTNTTAAQADKITPNVALTRGISQGIYNTNTESGFTHFVSPQDTEWANGTTASYSSLTYTDWNTWAKITNPGPPSTVGVNAVLHLISEDIYIDIKFLSWPAAAGGFVYQRSTPIVGNLPPTVAITTPTNTQSFTAPASVTITAAANDPDGSVTNVTFFNGNTFVGAVLNPPYSVGVNLGSGNFALTAVATDNLGLATTSSVVNISVGVGNNPPSVTVTNPANNAVFSSSANITLGAAASDSDGTVTNVQFFSDAVLVGSDATSPYSVSVRLPIGAHAITALAWDNQGATNASLPITITASNYLSLIPKGGISVLLQPVAINMGAPDYALSPPGDSNRLFVVEQIGLLRVIENGVLLPQPALDITALISTSLTPANANDERGFLGLAFHPGYNSPASPGYRTLYTYNTQPLGTGPTYPAPNNAAQGYKLAVNEWKITATNATVVDPASVREIISFGKNANNHNGGTIAFGPDSYLYLAIGDGGNANDVGDSHIEPGGNAQNLSTPLGKMLRFNPLHPSLNPTSADPVSPNGQYRIPTTNPFQAPGQVPEIYAYGLRNPYRFSFDRLNGDLIVADVGQNNIEEIDRVVLGGNYGWAIKEGEFLFNRTNGPAGAAGTIGTPPGNRSPGFPVGLIDPIAGTQGVLQYDHNDGISITGGFVYRGTAIPELYGKYVFGDLAIRNAPPRVDGRLFYADFQTGLIKEFLLPQFAAGILPNGLTVHGFGQDADGELYALVTNTPSNGTGGIVYRFVPFRLTVQPVNNQLQISWPVIGGRLEVQTNSIAQGLGSNWVTVPGSTTTNRIFVPVDAANGSVFYRLAYP